MTKLEGGCFTLVVTVALAILVGVGASIYVIAHFIAKSW